MGLQVLPDVLSEVSVLEIYLRGLGERLAKSILLVLTIGADRQDTATIGDGLSFLEGGTSMKHYGSRHLINSLYWIALDVSLRIATTDKHHAHHTSRVGLNLILVEVALGNTFQQIHQVALEAADLRVCPSCMPIAVTVCPVSKSAAE